MMIMIIIIIIIIISILLHVSSQWILWRELTIFFCFLNFLDGKRSIEKQIRFPGRLAIRIIYVIDCPTQLFIQVSFL